MVASLPAISFLGVGLTLCACAGLPAEGTIARMKYDQQQALYQQCIYDMFERFPPAGLADVRIQVEVRRSCRNWARD